MFKTLKTNMLTNRVIKRALSSVNQTGNHYDIIIAGGGMIGTTLACTLGKNTKLSNKRILLLEGSKRKEFNLTEKYSNRVSTLNSSTHKLLNEINVWPFIEKTRYGLVKKMQVWDGLSDALITFNNVNLNDVVAYVVENDVLIEAASEELSQMENVEVLFEAKIKDCLLGQTGKAQQINLTNGEEYSCNLLLGCDGANSQVRKSMDVQYIGWSYNQMGVVATLKLSESTENVVAWQKFIPTGPIALLPLTNDLSSLVWSTTPRHAKELLNLPKDQFIDALNDAIWKNSKRSNLVDNMTKTFDNCLRFLNFPSDAVRQLPPKIINCEEGSRAAFPLGFGHATNYIGKGVALVGDAAHRIHPLAGQGVNLGFGDIICLNEVLGEASYNGSKLDNLNYLKEYETKRQRHNVATMIGIEGLHQLYRTELTPIVLLRSLGLQATHALTPIKRLIMQQAAN